MREIIIGSRKSKLALEQTKQVIEEVKSKDENHRFIIKEMSTRGDRNLNISLDQFAGRGVFNLEIDQALIEQKIDVAIHSMKDLPIETSELLTVAAIPRREDPREALISANHLTLEQLPRGAIVGTSSARRSAQLKAIRPDLQTKQIRGPIDDRIAQLQRGDYDAILLAVAGLKRLQLENYITEYLPLDSFLPAACQGALTIQCRSSDIYLKKVFQLIHDEETALATEAERSLIEKLDKSEKTPIGCLATVDHNLITLRAIVLSKDGTDFVQGKAQGKIPEEVASILAKQLLDKGAGQIIERYACL